MFKIKLKFIVESLIMLAVITSCETKQFSSSEKNGVVYFHNKGSRGVKNLRKIMIKDSLVIDFNSDNENARLANPFAVLFDKDENIYIADGMAGSVKKFNSRGKFLKKIGSKGSGPGEMKACSNIFIYEDNLYIYDSYTFRFNIFDLEGNFKRSLNVREYLQNIKLIGNNFVAITKEVKEGKFFIFKLTLFTIEGKKVKDLLVNEIRWNQLKNINLLNYFPVFNVINQKIFVAKNSSQKYEFMVFDSQGELLEVYKKSYSEIFASEKELQTLRESYQNQKRAYIPDPKGNLKNSIMDILPSIDQGILIKRSVDRNNRLYADDYLYFDYYQKGKLLKTCKFENIRGSYFITLNKKFIKLANKFIEINNNKERIIIYQYSM